MPANFNKVRPGQKLSIAADTWNAVLDAAKDFTTAKRGALPVQRSTGEYKIFKNTTGAELLRGQWVGLGDPYVLPQDDNAYQFFSGRQIYTGEALSVSTHGDGRFGYVLQNTADGITGHAAITGIVPCKINVNAESDEYATIADAQPEALESQSAASNLRIWWKETGTGDDKWALVEILRGGAGGGVQFVQAIADGASGEVSVKNISFLADVTATPNYQQSGDSFDLKYLKG